MDFECKLAHSEEIKKVSNFNSIKELYEQISQKFELKISDILYCTLNTHNFRDVNSILSNYLSFGDLIIVHLCGTAKVVQIKKTHEFLGLTITDNAIGRAFVKRVKSDDKHVTDNIKPGDHIAALNNESTVGLRHFEVAKAIRQLPQNMNFTICLVEPIYLEKYFKRDALKGMSSNGISFGNDKVNSTDGFNLSNNLSLNGEDLINSSLPIDKLLSKGVRDGGKFKFVGDHDSYKVTINKINTFLESFLGINDNLLAIKIYRLAKENKESYSSFSYAVKQSELCVFNFDEEMKNYLWKCVTDLTIQ